MNHTSFTAIVQSLNHIWLFETPWTAAHQASLSFTISQSSSKLMAIVSMIPPNHLILCCPLVLLPSIFPSIGVVFNELALHIRWSKHWNFSFSIRPSNEYLGLTSFRIDWFDLLAVQGALKSLLQHNLKASILQCSAVFMAQLSHLYIFTELLLKVGYVGNQINEYNPVSAVQEHTIGRNYNHILNSQCYFV